MIFVCDFIKWLFTAGCILTFAKTDDWYLLYFVVGSVLSWLETSSWSVPMQLEERLVMWQLMLWMQVLLLLLLN